MNHHASITKAGVEDHETLRGTALDQDGYLLEIDFEFTRLLRDSGLSTALVEVERRELARMNGSD